jgi:predicted alpha/beta-hydrolase family hydrolase
MPDADYAPDFLFDGPTGETDSPILALAHGAGGAMDSPFLKIIAQQVGEAGIRVARFEFPYMQARRLDGKRRPPNGARTLEQAWATVIEKLTEPLLDDGGQRLVIGGKSMGGRIASMVADSQGVAGLVCLGYPFHPPGKPEKTRTAHLADLRTPTLILQGERDALGSREDVAGYILSPAIEVRWLGDGDHSLKPRKRSGRTEAENLREASDAIVAFVRGLDA